MELELALRNKEQSIRELQQHGGRAGRDSAEAQEERRRRSVL